MQKNTFFQEEQDRTMNEKNRVLFRVIAGGYLTYLGVDLLKNTINGKTDNPIMFGGFGVAFLIIGVGYVLYSLKRYRDRGISEEEIEDVEYPEKMMEHLDTKNENNEE